MAFAFSNRRNKPAFDVRFLAAKSILSITIKSLSVIVFLLQILTCQFFFHPMGERKTSHKSYVFRLKRQDWICIWKNGG